uniref:NADH-ubiquinone oxidoreductase chain 6 n=1 Tax=Limnogonus poissoni TaxID=913173 RepID=A0A5B9XX08_9HEMI|nr:NADH dehydrogenase subunit 6 [Limnogonus poissoni]QEH58887.1 NADH dehydrogenase subunit 6 [Limnogonus poissoni]QEH58901.1 NADH dehydrogenase subunit 6 [Limnogonus poissoni]
MLLTLSTSIMMTSHPLSMGFTLILQTVVVSMIMNLTMKYSWYSYILVLVMLGGMLVLFMYMASIASNEIMKFKMKFMMISISIFFLFWILNSTEIMAYNSESLIMSECGQNMPLTKLFNTKSSSMTIVMATYLLITMIYVIYITNTFEGPMRKKNYEKTYSEKPPIN